MSDTEPLYHLRRAIQVAENQGLDDEKELLEQGHNEIVAMREGSDNAE